jgi:hypothetical protein
LIRFRTLQCLSIVHAGTDIPETIFPDAYAGSLAGELSGSEQTQLYLKFRQFNAPKLWGFSNRRAMGNISDSSRCGSLVGLGSFTRLCPLYINFTTDYLPFGADYTSNNVRSSGQDALKFRSMHMGEEEAKAELQEQESSSVGYRRLPLVTIKACTTKAVPRRLRRSRSFHPPQPSVLPLP